MSFTEFATNNPNWKTAFNVYDRDHDSTYQRIKISCHTTCTIEGIDSEIFHEFHPVINVKTGEIFTDCRRRKIFAKHLTCIFLRPIHILIKTIWHASIILPLISQGKKLYHNKQTKEETLNNIKNSIKDIIRTPCYGVAMTVVSLAAVVLAVFSPNFLYRTRDFVGKLERKLHRTTKWRRSDYTFSPCFSPINNIQHLNEYTLKRFAIRQIRFRMESKGPFNDCYTLLPKNKNYVSAAASKKLIFRDSPLEAAQKPQP